MEFGIEIGGVGFRLNPAAISCVRYRAEYGDSIVNHLTACKPREAEGYLLRMCRCMMEDAPELPALAALAADDPAFLPNALAAQARLLEDDPQRAPGRADGERFDEYQVLALMAAARLDMALLYELPVMHIVSVVNRCFKARSGGKTYHRMDESEMARLYPR